MSSDTTAPVADTASCQRTMLAAPADRPPACGEGAGIEARHAAALAELISRIAACGDLQSACSTLVTELAGFLSCRQVILGLCPAPDKPCRLVAVSDGGPAEGPDGVREREAALEESIVRGTLTVWPCSDPAERHGMLAHQKLGRRTSSECVISAPLRDGGGRLVGAWVVLADEQFGQQPWKFNFLRASQSAVGSCLSLQQRAERDRLSRGLSHAVSLLRRWPGRLSLLAIVVLSAILSLPAPYRVRCACQLEPVTRRFVAAPFEGKLEECLVEPGDLVKPQQLLARMDGQEIRWELAAISADLARVTKQLDGHLATGAYGAAELARYELERLKVKQSLLKRRHENLEIRSTTEAIVLSGDLKKAEGAPLELGQTLFELAPLERMLVEIAIPDHEVAYVEPGLPVEIMLDAFPGKVWRGKLARIRPRAEIKEQENVFAGVVALTNPDKAFRPGMRGRARITAASRPLAWNLFHKPWDRFVLWCSW